MNYCKYILHNVVTSLFKNAVYALQEEKIFYIKLENRNGLVRYLQPEKVRGDPP